jgi:hypothetical protein
MCNDYSPTDTRARLVVTAFIPKWVVLIINGTKPPTVHTKREINNNSIIGFDRQHQRDLQNLQWVSYRNLILYQVTVQDIRIFT